MDTVSKSLELPAFREIVIEDDKQKFIHKYETPGAA